MFFVGLDASLLFLVPSPARPAQLTGLKAHLAPTIVSTRSLCLPWPPSIPGSTPRSRVLPVRLNLSDAEPCVQRGRIWRRICSLAMLNVAWLTLVSLTPLVRSLRRRLMSVFLPRRTSPNRQLIEYLLYKYIKLFWVLSNFMMCRKGEVRQTRSLSNL
jgi:hypothetical protein